MSIVVNSKRGRCTCEIDVQADVHSDAYKNNCNLRSLTKDISGQQGKLYLYVVKEAEASGNRLRIKGAPNLEGGRITLCTCKGTLRSYLAASDWPGNWVAGITGPRFGELAHFLLYLIRIGNARESFAELCSLLSASVIAAKAAHRHVNGDVFVPKSSSNMIGDNRYNPQSYIPPTRHHVHWHADNNKGNYGNPRWWRDIDELVQTTNRRPAYLVGDPSMSFVWTLPLIHVNGVLHTQGARKFVRVRDFLELCEERT